MISWAPSAASVAALKALMEMQTPFDPVAIAVGSGLEPPPSPPEALLYMPVPEALTQPMVIVDSEGRSDVYEHDFQLSVARGPLGMFHGQVVSVRSEWVSY